MTVQECFITVRTAYYDLVMTLRSGPTSSSGVVALDYEIAQEQASALGRLGRALEAALATLSDYDRAEHPSADAEHRIARASLMHDAGDALWCFMVQRESIGLRDPRPVMREYCVPVEVQNRMGVFGGRSRASA
jgi:hypothetical protein